ncbi:putative membrane protein YccC [Streptacidiphilus sp. BW17]|uniref:FUSC family protein n=1 Tax=Streptacidiphilus sp. BW17 TaxID=3156274 RepID=UPI003516882C
MSAPHRQPSAAPGRIGVHLARALAREMSSRGVLVLQPVDGALLFAVRAATAMAIPALPIALAGQSRLAVYAMLGAFTTAFGRNMPYRRRAWVLAAVALAMTTAVAAGSALAALARPAAGGEGAVVVIAVTAAVAGTAKFACDAARLSGLGAVLLLFSFAVAANGSATGADIGPQTGVAAAGAASAWVLSLVGWLWHPDRPQRLAVAAALRAVADVVGIREPGEVAPAARQRATVAVLQAYRTLGAQLPTAAEREARGGVCVRLADLSWSLLISSARQPQLERAVVARQLRAQVRLLVNGRRRSPVLLAELRLRSVPEATGGACSCAARTRRSPVEGAAGLRAAELITGHAPDHSRHLAVLIVPALRMALGTGVAGGLALTLGLGHGYWAAISAAAVLHSVNLRTTAQRAVQRTLGTLAGLLIAIAVLAAGPDTTVLAMAIVLLEFSLEYFVARNYALGVVFLTPLALLMSELAAPTSTEDLILDRGLSSLLGIGVGLLCALLVARDRAAVRVERALLACRQACDRAERPQAVGAVSLQPAQMRLAAAVVELREADDAAAGELLQAGVDPAVLAAEEQRAYALLDRMLHGG